MRESVGRMLLASASTILFCCAVMLLFYEVGCIYELCIY